jgi:hypothetical protein
VSRTQLLIRYQSEPSFSAIRVELFSNFPRAIGHETRMPGEASDRVQSLKRRAAASCEEIARDHVAVRHAALAQRLSVLAIARTICARGMQGTHKLAEKNMALFLNTTWCAGSSSEMTA